MGRRSKRHGEAQRVSPDELGLPEHSPFTIEGRIERAGMAGNYLVRRRRGQERPLHRSQWAIGLGLIFAALVAILAATLIAFLV
jgi:hypothetical protein